MYPHFGQASALTFFFKLKIEAASGLNLTSQFDPLGKISPISRFVALHFGQGVMFMCS
jgi:hypothetical protein